MKTNKTIPEVPLRIHIAPVGFEEDRIVIPAEKMRAEKVILITNEEGQEKGALFYEKVIERLRKDNIEVEMVKTSFFNLEKNMLLFSNLINKHRDQQLFINISSGSKIQALAGFISVMSAKSQGILVSTYYVEPEEYNDNPPRFPISRGFKQIINLPIFPLHMLSKEIQSAMLLLKKKPYYKLELAIELAKQGFFPQELLDKCDNKPVNEKARIRLQNLAENRVINPMNREKYIEMEKVGRHIKITLTSFGDEATHLFINY